MTQAGKTLRMSALVRQTSHPRRLTCQRTIRNAKCGGQTTRLGLEGDKEFGVTTTTWKVSILPIHGVTGSSEAESGIVIVGNWMNGTLPEEIAVIATLQAQ
ncbi:hypothetical protein JMJ77_0011503 [Colletotrichum scovillei]|uniref:Uncharacterized protein n=1 Tax=Colletotrichum scovillei TaxID=1209932 RepID=A0A9P7QX84_9PEZI|nr:hypothetical protein JMJ77_0011503 [Colletotrichum scovillei]KAG7045785.1 hypothetical protein JMJ78_0010856 [Colletotrichum scovillei]KAG7063129.1 hypothetical protein JMJ76_0005597 [Colletotrichum scovillei]